MLAAIPPRPVSFWDGVGKEEGGQTPNYATGLANLQAPFFVDQSLSRMGLLWGVLGSAGGSAPPLLAKTPASRVTHPHVPRPPLSLFARQRDIILQQQDTIVWSSMPSSAAAAEAARNTRSKKGRGRRAGGRRERGGGAESGPRTNAPKRSGQNHDAAAAAAAAMMRPVVAWRIPPLAYHSHAIRMPYRGTGTAHTHMHTRFATGRFRDS